MCDTEGMSARRASQRSTFHNDKTVSGLWHWPWTPSREHTRRPCTGTPSGTAWFTGQPVSRMTTGIQQSPKPTTACPTWSLSTAYKSNVKVAPAGLGASQWVDRMIDTSGPSPGRLMDRRELNWRHSVIVLQ